MTRPTDGISDRIDRQSAASGVAVVPMPVATSSASLTPSVVAASRMRSVGCSPRRRLQRAARSALADESMGFSFV